jgi:hypothetical protein
VRPSARRLIPVLLACVSCQGGQAVTVPTQYAVINGAVTSSLGGGVAGATVVITPSGGSSLAAITTNANGNYTAPSVPVTNQGGRIAVSGVPSSCATPQPTTYEPLVAGFARTVNIAVTCQTPVDSLTGTVTSNSGASLAHVGVVATPAGDSALAAVTTSASGAFVVAPIPSTSGAITLSSVPANCVTPSPVSYTGTGANTVTSNIVLTCSSSGVGVITGTISSSLGGTLSGVGVVVTPYGALPLPAVPSNGTGVYRATGVPVSNSTGSVTVAGLPANCGDPGSTPYSSLVNGATITVNVTVTCH